MADGRLCGQFTTLALPSPAPRQQRGEIGNRVIMIRASTSASHACGSTSFSRAVYDDRRTIPNGMEPACHSGAFAAIERTTFHNLYHPAD
jgi:hypothetical protein